MAKHHFPRLPIALLVESSRAYGRGLLQGVARFARTQVRWSILHQEMTLDSDMPAWISRSDVRGVIARVDTHSVDALRQLGVPMVDVRCNRKFQGIPQVETNNQRVSELAFEHLWERGFRRFAFCGFRFASYSDVRQESFRRLVERSQCPIRIYESPGSPQDSIMGLEQAGVQEIDQLARWVATLERPTGLFVCNDIRGQQVLNACRNLDVAIPDDLAVIGVDDDEAICQLCDPPLSSVRPNAEDVGYRAAELLHEMIMGLTPAHDFEVVEPTCVSERESTRVIAVDDEEIARVCRFIRQSSCEGIDVGDLVAYSKLSRRQLERRFRTTLKKTPRELITETQIQRVKQLLAETDMTLSEIAPRAGYGHKESLSAVFKRVTGQTPGQYRSSATSAVADAEASVMDTDEAAEALNT